MLHKASSTTYYIRPDDTPYSKNAHSLAHYLMNSNNYFNSHTKLQFLSGSHYLQHDLVLQNITNFTISGNGSVIQCNGLAITIEATNVTNLELRSIQFANCGRKENRVLKNYHNTFAHKCNGVLCLNHCNTVKISGLTVIANPDVSAIVAVNVLASSFEDVKIAISCVYPNYSSSPVNGIEFYFSDYKMHHTQPSTTITSITYDTTIRNYIYDNDGFCNSSYALFLVLIQESYGISMAVQDTNFAQFFNSSVLYYHGESCGQYIDNNIAFYNCCISNNIGNINLNMFEVLVHSDGYIYSSHRDQRKCDTQSNTITFSDCSFVNNSNMNSLLYFDIKSTLLFNARINIKYSHFLYNHELQIIKVNSEVKVLWQLSHHITLAETIISSNWHNNLVSMISSTNGNIELSNALITNNTYETILTLYFSVLGYEKYVEFSSNSARFIIQAEEGSYYLLKEYTTVNITQNQVYTSTITSAVYNERLDQICYYQFVSDRGNLDHEFAVNKTLNYKILFVNNTYSAPWYEIKRWSSRNCSWLPEIAFYSSKSSKVYGVVVESNVVWASRKIIESTMSIVCPCSAVNEFDCMERHLGSVYPGQTLTAKLIIVQLYSLSNTMIADTSKSKHACKITDAQEISQTYPSHTCNEYNYTVSSNRHECELYLGPEGIPEVFYVTVNPCPPGFFKRKKHRSCHCDPALKSFTTSCNLQDQAIMRPPKSWIAGRSSNRSHVYSLSHNCPFDYCLPHKSYVNLSMPDQQCQYKRSGILCGHCQHGLSAVFGSSHCKQCSSVHLLIVVPIAIAGAVLVVMIFWLNITVTNGIINTFIFYANVININFSLFFPKCHSGCVLFAFSNLELGVDTCFYNGMDAFSKTCLRLVFPFYLLLIVFALIIGSRYSTKIQRLTAQRALPVLATLLLLIYTKILITVCSVLFFFSPITHLPGGHITFVWSVDTKVPLFGIRFSILFAFCLILFLILLPFNVLLLFPRMFSRFRLINAFKPLLDAYLGPYKDSFSYWMGLQLFLRAVFLGLSALDRDVTLTIGTVILGAMLCIEGLVCPFKSRFKNIQECTILLNLLAVYVTALHDDGSREIEPRLLQCLILTVLLYFVVYIACHSVMSTCGNTVVPKFNVIIAHINTWKKRFTNDSSTAMLEVIESERPDMACSDYEQLQESLIAFNN